MPSSIPVLRSCTHSIFPECQHVVGKEGTAYVLAGETELTPAQSLTRGKQPKNVNEQINDQLNNRGFGGEAWFQQQQTNTFS